MYENRIFENLKYPGYMLIIKYHGKDILKIQNNKW